jgi:hypothetical protein
VHAHTHTPDWIEQWINGVVAVVVLRWQAGFEGHSHHSGSHCLTRKARQKSVRGANMPASMKNKSVPCVDHTCQISSSSSIRVNRRAVTDAAAIIGCFKINSCSQHTVSRSALMGFAIVSVRLFILSPFASLARY